MFVVGLLDDLVGVKPQGKLLAQITAALALSFLGYHFNPELPYVLDLTILLLWVLGITNAMNLLDNMDGLSAGVAATAAVFFFWLFASDGNTEGALLSLVLCGTMLGFLVFNFSPASVLMGNSGSLLVGFFLASLHLTTSQTDPTGLLSILVFPVLVLALPIFDTTFVSLTRWFSGRKVSVGATDHASHRLVAVGLSERQAVLVLYAIAISSGLLASALYRLAFSYSIFGAALSVLGLVLFGIFLSTVSVYEEGRLPVEVRDKRWFTLITEFTYKRQMLWVLVDALTIGVAYYLGYLTRFGGTAEWDEQFALFARSSPIVVSALLVSLTAKGLYRSDWRHFSLHEARLMTVATTIGLASSILLLTYLFRFAGYSRGVFLITWATTLGALSATRLFVRMLSETLRPGVSGGKRVLIYGAGIGGQLALTEIGMNRTIDQVPVGFIDDDQFKHGTVIHGLPVLGALESLEFLVRKHQIDAIVISTRNLTERRREMLAAAAERLDVAVYCVTIDVSEWKAV